MESMGAKNVLSNINTLKSYGLQDHRNQFISNSKSLKQYTLNSIEIIQSRINKRRGNITIPFNDHNTDVQICFKD